MIETDIRFGNLYVCIEKDTIEAVFFYKDGIGAGVTVGMNPFNLSNT